MKEISREGTDEGSLDHDISIGFIEDNRLVSRVIRVRNEIDHSPFFSEFLQCGLIIDECDDDISTLCYIRLFQEDEVSIIDSFLIHGVSLSSEKEVLIYLIHDLRRDRDLCLDILLSEYRHPTGNRPDEGNVADSVAITLECRCEVELISEVSVDPSLRHDLVEHDRD